MGMNNGEKYGLDIKSFLGCPHTSRRPAGMKVDTIVIHYTAGGHYLKSSVAWFMDPRSVASAHFVVGRGGEIAQLVGLDMAAWHAGSCQLGDRRGVNGFSVGIELANWGPVVKKGGCYWVTEGSTRKPYDQKELPVSGSYTLRSNRNHQDIKVDGYWEPYKELQIDSTVKLCHMLVDTLGIPINNIVGHEDIAEPVGRKTDPGPLWNWEQFNRQLMRCMGKKFIMGSRFLRRVKD